MPRAILVVSTFVLHGLWVQSFGCNLKAASAVGHHSLQTLFGCDVLSVFLLPVLNSVTRMPVILDALCKLPSLGSPCFRKVGSAVCDGRI